jgi:histidinol-phosphate phosphatase family protein
MEKNKAIFLDKDGTLVENSGYPEIIPSDDLMETRVIQGLRKLQGQGYKLIIVSNQSWISKKRLTKDEVEEIFSRLIKKLEYLNIIIDDYFYCPHKREEKCCCKKPNPGMILEAIEKHNIDLSKSFMIGDSEDDILAAKKINLKSVLVTTGIGNNFLKIGADYIVEDINHFAELI